MGNVAVAEVELAGGRSFEMRAGSAKTRSDDINGWTQSYPEGQRKLAYLDLGPSEPAAFTHSEYKILDELAHTLPPSEKGVVAIYRERPPCNSCNHDMVLSFLSQFPNMEVRIYYGLTDSGQSVLWYSYKNGQLFETIIPPPRGNSLFPPFK